MRAILMAAVAFYAIAARADDSPMNPSYAESRGWVKPHLSGLAAVAMRDAGRTCTQMGLPARLCCGDAVNRWRRLAGMQPVASRRALDQARGGRRIASPAPGSLMITSRRGGGHVDVVAAVHGDGTITVVRPNWTRRVKVERIRPHGRFYLPA